MNIPPPPAKGFELKELLILHRENKLLEMLTDEGEFTIAKPPPD
jgi:hypothetical protein